MVRSSPARASRGDRRVYDFGGYLEVAEPEALADKFSHRYGISVFTICLGGAIMGFLLAAALTINRVLVPGPDELLVRLPASFIPGLVGAALGQVLSLVESLIVALSLAAILGGANRG